MAIFSGPEEIYRELVEESEEDWLYGLVAFAVIEERRIEWMKHQEEHTGNPPSSNEVVNWYKQQPEGVFLRAKEVAEASLKDYSDKVFELVIDDYTKEVQKDIIVSEIRELKAFWPQFGVNVAGGVVASILVAALLVIVAFIALNDTSPAEIGTELRQQFEEPDNAE